jgi:V/A-type H+-transporting ATPase subunit I
VFFYAGIATILWGAAYGSYFGFTVKPNLIEPMNDPLKMLIVSLAVGGLHIITGILIKAYDDIRRGRYFDALFDQFSWVLILAGLGMLFVPGLDAVGGALAVTGAAIILVTGGRKSKGVFGKLFGGLGGLYNVTGYLSDILSYSRILALSLSTAIIGWVMNMLAGMFTGSAFGYIIGAVIFIVGHLFNLVMGILSAYVHDLRLQFIEFFNRFYQGGGYPFEPLSLKLQYVDKVKIGNLQGGINHE